MKLYMYILLCWLPVFAFPLVAIEADPIALCVKVKGQVDWHHKDKVNPLKNGQALYEKDKLISYNDSYAALKFVDGSALMKLFPNSTITISASLKDKKLQKKTILRRGSVYSRILENAGDYEVETPTSIASVKGTRFLDMADENGNTDLYVFSGKVELRNLNDDNSVIVEAGEHAFTTGTGEITVNDFELDDLPGEIKEDLTEERNPEKLEIELRNDKGERKTIHIEFE